MKQLTERDIINLIKKYAGKAVSFSVHPHTILNNIIIDISESNERLQVKFKGIPSGKIYTLILEDPTET
jgi:hypothetical protein